MPGVFVSKSEINATAGDIARKLVSVMRRAASMKKFLDAYTAQSLVDNFGLTLEDANILKSAFTEFATINVTLQANDNSIKKLTGIGDVE